MFFLGRRFFLLLVVELDDLEPAVDRPSFLLLSLSSNELDIDVVVVAVGSPDCTVETSVLLLLG